MNQTQTMLKVERNPKMQAAIARCKSVHPRARRINRNTVKVQGRNGEYTVTLAAPRPGLLLAACNCKAGEAGMLCFHIPAAVVVPGTIAAPVLQQEGAAAPPSCAVSRQAKTEAHKHQCPTCGQTFTCSVRVCADVPGIYCNGCLVREIEQLDTGLPRGNQAASSIPAGWLGDRRAYPSRRPLAKRLLRERPAVSVLTDEPVRWRTVGAREVA